MVGGPMALESNACGPVKFNPKVCCVISSSGNGIKFFIRKCCNIFFAGTVLTRLGKQLFIEAFCSPASAQGRFATETHWTKITWQYVFFFEWISKWTMLDASNTTLISHKDSSKNPTFWIPKCCDFANAHKLFEHADQINRFLFWILWFTNYDILEILQSAPIFKRFWSVFGELMGNKLKCHRPKSFPTLNVSFPTLNISINQTETT